MLRKIIGLVLFIQRPVSALVYAYYSNIEHNRKKNEINAFIHTITFQLNGIYKKEYTNVTQQTEQYAYYSINNMEKGY